MIYWMEEKRNQKRKSFSRTWDPLCMVALHQLLRVGPMEEHYCSGGGKNGDGEDRPHLHEWSPQAASWQHRLWLLFLSKPPPLSGFSHCHVLGNQYCVVKEEMKIKQGGSFSANYPTKKCLVERWDGAFLGFLRSSSSPTYTLTDITHQERLLAMCTSKSRKAAPCWYFNIFTMPHYFSSYFYFIFFFINHW